MVTPIFLPRQHTLRQAWGEYIARLPEIIGEPFEYWGTLTYRSAEELPARHAEDITSRRVGYFIGQVNTAIYGRRWKRKGESVWGAVATEKHLSGYPHHHLIMGGAKLRQTLKRLQIMDMWDNLYGIARIADYKGEAGAKYIVKYVGKGSVIDVFGGDNVRAKLKP